MSAEPVAGPTPELAAIFYASPEVLAQLLQLPPGAYIDGVDSPIDQPGALRFRIRGAGWPTKPGYVLNGTTPTITRLPEADGYVVDWRLPEAAS